VKGTHTHRQVRTYTLEVFAHDSVRAITERGGREGKGQLVLGGRRGGQRGERYDGRAKKEEGEGERKRGQEKETFVFHRMRMVAAGP